MKRSAGVMAYRRAPQLEVLVGHPGGPFWARKHEGAWTIVKGEYGDDEPPEVAARREFREETGVACEGPLIELGTAQLKSGKVIVAYAAEMQLDPDELISNEIEVEWPPRSGKRIRIPEIDRFAWCSPDEARTLLNPAQCVFVDRLQAILGA